MDPLTHALSGALLARATAPSVQLSKNTLPLRARIIVGFSAAAFPDVDLALRLIDTLTYLNWHQGPTHSLVLLPMWAFLLSCLFSRLVYKRYPWKVFYLPVCLGLAIHILGDLVTSYGLMLLAPFSTQRFLLPLVFVIDPWFSLIIISGLLFSIKYPMQRIVAICALVGLLGYVSFLWNLHGRALSIGLDYAKAEAIKRPDINVLPQPLSPFNWKIIVSDDKTYHVAYINLRRDRMGQQHESNAWVLKRMAISYQSYTHIVWQRINQFGDNIDDVDLVYEAWRQHGFERFRKFAVYPALNHIDYAVSGTCFWYIDLRFQFPELPPSFRYGMCHDSEKSDWQLQRQQGWFLID